MDNSKRKRPRFPLDKDEIQERMAAFWARIEVSDKYNEFIDTGKIAPLAEAVIKSPDNADFLMRAIEMLEDHRGYPWVIKRQFEKLAPKIGREKDEVGRPPERTELVDMRLTFIKVAIEKHETWLSWAGHKKVTDKMLLEKIWAEDLPPVVPFNLSSSSKYNLLKTARQHKPQNLRWLNDVEIILMENDLDYMAAFIAAEHAQLSK
ncbi:hypothetical protein N8932_02730 [Alphaproteobacteria bacterium]|nr:hypothetical protein [Alphaproteobacteria bacterium]